MDEMPWRALGNSVATWLDADTLCARHPDIKLLDALAPGGWHVKKFRVWRRIDTIV